MGQIRLDMVVCSQMQADEVQRAKPPREAGRLGGRTLPISEVFLICCNGQVKNVENQIRFITEVEIPKHGSPRKSSNIEHPEKFRSCALPLILFQCDVCSVVDACSYGRRAFLSLCLDGSWR